MKHIDKFSLSLIVLFILALLSCSENTTNISEKTTKPQILSLTANKSIIEFGGLDPAIITCDASGGNIEYTWEVDLGDIFPINNDNSIVRFSGSPCCIGKKVITCTAANDKGTDTKTIEIIIKEP